MNSIKIKPEFLILHYFSLKSIRLKSKFSYNYSYPKDLKYLSQAHN